MSDWGAVCRICSSPANYEIFAKIPIYLHEAPAEFLKWQKPINVLITEVTGLKVAKDDGFPDRICAICVSYLKHAVGFREQTLSNAMALKAIQVLQETEAASNGQPLNDSDKARLVVNIEDLEMDISRQLDSNELLNNGTAAAEQNKVKKELLNNSFCSTTPNVAPSTQEQMRYLNKLFGKDASDDIEPSHANNTHALNVSYGGDMKNGDAPNASMSQTVGVGDDYDEELLSSCSSNSGNETHRKANKGGGDEPDDKNDSSIFVPKNFVEDDVMDSEELQRSVSIYIPGSCKERKCRACFRRYMLEDSFQAHLGTCIEYKFLTFAEQMNKIMLTRRRRGVSPHECIRQLIEGLRVQCEWLQTNCSELLLLDFMGSGSSGGADATKPTQLQEDKSSATSTSTSADQQSKCDQRRQKDSTDSISLDEAMNNLQMDEDIDRLLRTKDYLFQLDTDMFNNCSKRQTPPPLSLADEDLLSSVRLQHGGAASPTSVINMENNILYEIERSQSRQSQSNQPLRPDTSSRKQFNSDPNHFTVYNNNPQVMKPIPVRATSANLRVDTATPSSTEEERSSFMQKLKNAALSPSPTTFLRPSPSLITVRQDLLPKAEPKLTLPKPAPQFKIPQSPDLLRNFGRGGRYSARCNPCNLNFESLANLELHNAQHHNAQQQNEPPAPTFQPASQAWLTQTKAKPAAGGRAGVSGTATADVHRVDKDLNSSHDRIIALFENDSEASDS